MGVLYIPPPPTEAQRKARKFRKRIAEKAHRGTEQPNVRPFRGNPEALLLAYVEMERRKASDPNNVFGPVVCDPAKLVTSETLITAIMKVVAEKYEVTKLDLLSDRRTARVVLPRQIGMYLAKTMTTRSLPFIGARFGKRDHTTVLHAVNKITALCDADVEFAAEVRAIKEAVKRKTGWRPD